MNEENLKNYYNKFNEDKRLNSRHGIVEFKTTMKYITKYLKGMNNPKILDVGAGTGKYSKALYDMGYDVTAVELVKHNLMTLKKNVSNIKSYLGNSLDLHRFDDDSFDAVLLFGPMYHLISNDDKIKALKEAKRVVKKDGYIFISYYMNDYAVIKHGFIEGMIRESIENNLLDNNYHVTPKNDDLYSMVRLSDINNLNNILNLKRVSIIAQDGASDYIRHIINKMDESMFNTFIEYHMSICELPELLGASSHVLDIIKK